MKSESRDKQRYFVEAAAKTLDILESFSDSEERLSITEVARRSNQPYTSAFRFLYTLEKRGYVMRVPGKRSYVLAPSRKRVRVGYASLGKIGFATEVTRSVHTAARRFGITLLAMDNEDNPSRTLANAERLLAEHIDILIEFQRNDTISHLIATKCHNLGVPSIAINFPQPGAYYFGPDSYRTGSLAGEYLVTFAHERWPDEPQIYLIIPSQGKSPSQSTREAGLHESLKKAFTGSSPRLESTPPGVTSQDGYRLMKRVLKKLPVRRPKIHVAAFSDPLAIGADRALREAEFQENSVVIGQGGTAEGRRHILRGGPLKASIAYFPESYGERLLKLAIRIVEGEHPPLSTFTDHVVLTRDNISEFYTHK